MTNSRFNGLQTVQAAASRIQSWYVPDFHRIPSIPRLPPKRAAALREITLRLIQFLSIFFILP